MLELFVAREFRDSTLAVINQANEIIEVYQEQGFTLTLRQLYYQFVARDLIPNRQSEYKRLGSIINDARLAGLIDWSAIEDRTRNVRGGDWGYESPERAILSIADGYGEPRWHDQPYHVEVWIEKDALLGVIEPACDRWRVNYFACRGSVSQSEMYAAGKRFAKLTRVGFKVLVLHLGDHDPSGVHMTEDNEQRLSMFAGRPIEVRRLALNMDQIREFNPPPNPAKETDARFGAYVREFGTDESWELDALEPRVIDGLIDSAIRDVVDHERWAAAEEQEVANREILQRLPDRWGEVQDLLGMGGDDADF